MKFTGICPKTKKLAIVYCTTIDCSTQDNPNNYTPGIMYACSVIKNRKQLCNECPINPLNKK